MTRIASSSVPCRGGRRRCSSAFSKCMWGSTKPGTVARPCGVDLGLAGFLNERFDGDDALVLDRDVDRGLVVADACLTNDEVHIGRSSDGFDGLFRS